MAVLNEFDIYQLQKERPPASAEKKERLRQYKAEAEEINDQYEEDRDALEKKRDEDLWKLSKKWGFAK